jgi:hypothetical protein
VDVRLPNGVIIQGVPDGITKEKLRRIAIKNGIAKPEDFADTGIVSSLVGGTKRFLSSAQTALESVTGSPEEAAIAGLKRGEEISAENAPGADFGKVSKTYEEEGLLPAVGEALSQVPTAAAEMAPFIGTTLAGAAVGQAAIPIPVAGALIGAAVPSLITRYGGNIEAQAAAQQAEKKPVEISRGTALAAAAPQAAIDTLANAFPILGRTAVAKFLGPAAEKALARGAVADAERIAKESLIKRVGKGMGENLAIQGVAQPTQVMITRLQAGQDLLSDEALSEYGHALYMAGLLSPIGAYGGIKERGQAKVQLAQRDVALDTARQKLFEASEAAKPAPDAPDLPMSALNIQRLLGIKLTEAGELKRDLIKRGDLVQSKGGGKTYKYFLNRDNFPKPEEAKTPEQAAKEPATPAFTGEQLLGQLTERTPEQIAADVADAAKQKATAKATAKAAAKAEVEGQTPPDLTTVTPTGETLPVVRKGKQKQPPAERITSTENPVFQTGASLVKQLHEAGTPITPENFRSALTPLIGKELPPLQVGNLLGALTRNNVLSKPDENKARAYIVPTEVPEFTGAKPREEVANEPVSAKPANVDLESVGRGVEPLVSGNRAGVVEPEGGVPGRVGGAGKPAVVGNAPERGVKPALREAAKPEEAVAERVEVPVAERVEVPVVEPPAAPRPQTIPEGEPVPRSAQPSAPDVFAPSPEQARVSTETIDSGLVPGRGIRRAEARMEEARQAQREREVPPPPEEGVSQKYDSVAESLRAGNLGEALYRLRNETEGKSPLYWLADRLFNVTEVKDDRSQLIKGETQRIAREQGIDKQKEPEEYAKLAESVNRTIMSDIDLSRYRFVNLKGEVDAKGKPTKLAELAKNFKPKFERMVPVGRGLASYNRATGKFEFLREAEPKKPDNRYLPYVVEPATTESPFKKTAFGGAKVFVEGGENVKGQNKAVIDRLQREGKLAEYNPKTNTFYFTEAGLTDRVILHEMVHSATVGVMKKYLSGKMGELTDIQRQGAKEIVDIYNDSKAVLGDKFKNAYESEYEFITYATTNEGFQRALSNLSAPKTARSKLRSAWDSFTLAVAKMVGLDKFARQKETDLSSSRTLEPGRGMRRVRVMAADEMNNALLRVIDSVGDILTVPKAGVEVEPLAARRQGQRRRRPAPIQQIRPPATQVPGSTQGAFLTPAAETRPTVGSYIKRVFSSKGLDEIAYLAQNYRRGFVTHEEAMDRAGLLRRGVNANNVSEKMTLAMGKQEVNDKKRVTPLVNSLSESVIKYADKLKLSIEDATERLGVYRMALNELEKRAFKYLEYVPLDDTPILTLNNQPISPAAYRDALFDYVVQNRDLVSNGEAQQIRAQLEQLAQRYAKVGGKSRNDRVPSNAADALDKDSKHYQVVGYDNTNLNAWRRAYAREMRQNGAEIRAVFDAIDAVNNERVAMEKEGNYWSQPVDNLKALYGYDYYVPFKGMDNGTADVSFDLDSGVRAGTQYRQLEDRAMGRTTAVNNPILQVVQDLHRASSRSASEGVTEALKNQIDGPTPTLDGKLIERVTFADKFNGKQRQDLSKYNVFFHHLADGTTEVYSLKNQKLIDGLNGFNSNLALPLRLINKGTHLMGKMHTFYNPAFAPFNFVRDALTNAYLSAGRFGVSVSPKMLAAVVKNIVASGVFTRAMKISWLYDNGNFAAIKNMKGQFAKDAYEYLVEQGGRGAFQRSFDIATVEKEAFKRAKLGGGVLESGKTVGTLTAKAVNKIFNTWADSFEFVSRASTYGVIKKELIAEAKSRGLNVNDPVFLKGMKEEAAAYTKNLFNYEQVGKYGRELGSLYMFMRPSLTSAVRVMDLLRPALESVDTAMERGPSLLKITDPADPNYAKAQAARQEFAARHAKESFNATILAMVLGGAGAAMYEWALSTADTDEQGRNVVATDDPSMWTRNARIPAKFAGEGNDFMNAPWGFGPGAFAALGAQLAILANGNQTTEEFIENLFPITLDSFIPVPAPRFSPKENPLEFAVDTIAPTPIKPFVEFMINTDSLGRQIYSERGDAYSAGMHVPKYARDFSAWLADNTAGFDEPLILDPQTTVHFVNNYLDAVGKLVSVVYGAVGLSSGDKEFNAKTDIPFASSFIGKRSSVDSRKFFDLQTELEDRKKLLKAYEGRPAYDEYVQVHPEAFWMVELYDKTINGTLKDLQTEKNQIEAGAGMYTGWSEREKQVALKQIRSDSEFAMGEFVKSIEFLKEQEKAD